MNFSQILVLALLISMTFEKEKEKESSPINKIAKKAITTGIIAFFGGFCNVLGNAVGEVFIDHYSGKKKND